MASTNKAITLSGFDMANPTSTFSVSELPIPTPSDNEVVVKMTLRPVNPADVFSIMGVYPGFQPTTSTIVPGLEGTGVVHAVGSNVTKFSVGQRVTGGPWPSVHGGIGTWQQYMIAPEDKVVAVPNEVSDEAAAQFWVNPVTVVGMLRVLNVPAGEYLVQTAAGSVLGRQMIQVCKAKGIKTINIVRRDNGLVDELKALGADEVIVGTGAEIAPKIMEITGGKGAFGGIDAVGGELLGAVASGVRANGTVIIYGAMSGLSATFSIPDPLFRGVVIQGFWLVPYMEAKDASGQKEIIDEVMSLLATKTITPYSGEKFPLEKAAEAVAASQQAARGGKVFLEG